MIGRSHVPIELARRGARGFGRGANDRGSALYAGVMMGDAAPRHFHRGQVSYCTGGGGGYCVHCDLPLVEEQQPASQHGLVCCEGSCCIIT